MDHINNLSAAMVHQPSHYWVYLRLEVPIQKARNVHEPKSKSCSVLRGVAEKANVRQSDIDSLEEPDQLLCEQLVLFSYVRPANGRIHVRPLVPRAVGAAQ